MSAPGDLETLIEVMDRLRDPGGCPWDHEQTFETLRRYLLEEAYEVAQAIDGGDREALCEELGDLLFEIVFLARLAREEGRFAMQDVIRGAVEKLTRRHPHVFGDAVAASADEVARNWEAIKRSERKSGGAPLLDSVPRALPPLLEARLLADRAAQVGFDWAGPHEVLAKVREELSEVEREVEQGAGEALADELGDLLFSLAMLARHLGVNADAAVGRANRKFRRRFGAIESELSRRGVALESAGQPELERLWQRVKADER